MLVPKFCSVMGCLSSAITAVATIAHARPRELLVIIDVCSEHLTAFAGQRWRVTAAEARGLVAGEVQAMPDGVYRGLEQIK